MALLCLMTVPVFTEKTAYNGPLVGVITTLAGTGASGFSGDRNPASRAQLQLPEGIAVDAAGNVYIADTLNQRIRKVEVGTAIITTVAGTGMAGFAGDGAAATAAQLNSPVGVAVDAAGNLYIADSGNNRIRKIVAVTGVISTVAGNGTAGYSGDHGVATAAQINFPEGVAVDTAGNLYIGDSLNHRVRRVTAVSGVIATFAGTGVAGFAGDGAAATSGQLDHPLGVALDGSRNLYIADLSNHRVRKVAAATGVMTTVAGNGDAGFSGENGAATSASLMSPAGVAVDSAGNLYIGDRDTQRARKVAAVTGVITTVAGSGECTYGGDEGAGPSAQLCFPKGVALDGSGNLFIADARNNRIRKVEVESAGALLLTTVAGTGAPGFSGDGAAAPAAQLRFPFGVAVDDAGNLFIADHSNHRIRKVSAATGLMTTVAGNGCCYGGDGSAATAAQLNYPRSVAVDRAGNLFIADTENHRIRKVTAATGVITTVAGTGIGGFSGDGVLATAAQLYYPNSVAVDGSGNLYIADTNNHRFRKVTAATGYISTVVGTGSPGSAGDGAAATLAQVSSPLAVALDPSGNLYIGDLSLRVRKVSAATGTITTVAGTGSNTNDFSGENGAARSANLSEVFALAVDGAGNVYIADMSHQRIRKVTAATGLITTIAGSADNGFGGDGGAASAGQLNAPRGVAVDSAGQVYIADTDNNRIRRAAPDTSPYVTLHPAPAFGCLGQGIQFTAGASGFPAPTVQWQVSTNGGASWTSIPGATSTLYSLTPSTADNHKQFRAVFTNATGADVTKAAGLTLCGSAVGDSDGDGRTDLALYRPSTGSWYILNSSGDYTTYMAKQWGISTDVPVPGDYDGDGKTDLGLYRPSTGYWYILLSSTGYTTYAAYQWGISTDVPVPGDYDGDGKTDLGLYRPSTGTWYVLQSGGNFTTYIAQQWGLSTDQPVAGDYDGDGKTDLGVYRPSTGDWYILLSSTNFATHLVLQWGLSSDIVVPGDFDGDGKRDLALYRPSTGHWYVLLSGGNYTTYLETQRWGQSEDIPVTGDYDGDGKTDLALYRAATGQWSVLLSSTSFNCGKSCVSLTRQWGISGDIPVFARQ